MRNSQKVLKQRPKCDIAIVYICGGRAYSMLLGRISPNNIGNGCFSEPRRDSSDGLITQTRIVFKGISYSVGGSGTREKWEAGIVTPKLGVR